MQRKKVKDVFKHIQIFFDAADGQFLSNLEKAPHISPFTSLNRSHMGGSMYVHGLHSKRKNMTGAEFLNKL